MFTDTPSYVEQARGLPKESPYQMMVLDNADFWINTRNYSKIAFVVSGIGCIASVALGYPPLNPSITCMVTSGVIWLCAHKLSQHFEPGAQKMLQHFRDLQAERANKPPAWSRLTSQEKRDGVRWLIQLLRANAEN